VIEGGGGGEMAGGGLLLPRRIDRMCVLVDYESKEKPRNFDSKKKKIKGETRFISKGSWIQCNYMHAFSNNGTIFFLHYRNKTQTPYTKNEANLNACIITRT